ncbi:hypothetical protein EDC01DRAFT_745248 [Geopyxis carbonaria]|nr:hypothetical protein EDC01DRAFT_745248 [Geopyxis carbonaria]
MMMPLDNEEMEGAFGTVPMREHSEEKELDIAGDNPEPEPISLLDRAKRLFGADPNAVDGDSTSECDTDNLPVSVSLSKKRKRTANLTTEAENENAISDKLTASNPNDEAEDAEMELPDQSLVVKLKVQKTPGPSPDPSKSLYVLGKKSKSSIMEPKSKKRAPLLPLRRRKTTPVPLPPVEDMDKSGDEPRASPLTPESGNEPSVAKSSGPKEVELPAKTPPMAENLGLPIPQQEIEEVGSGKSAGDGSADESDLEDGSAENAIPDDSGIADTTMTDYLAEPAEEQDKLDDTNIMGNNDLIGDTIDSRRHSNTRESTSAPTVTTETTQDNISVPTKPRSPASTKKAPVKTARHSTPTTSLMGRLEILEHGNTVLEKENRALWDRLQRLEQKIGFT